MTLEKRLADKKTGLSAVFSGLSKAAEKQQRPARTADFGQLAETFSTPLKGGAEIEDLKKAVLEDLDGRYPVLQSEAEKLADRGVLRALKWGEKVTTLQKSLIDRYAARGESIFDNADLFICDACGFVFLGEKTPDICPVCKAPSSRFSRVK